ncbi:hypothetical protein FN846DRAFT_929264, partial [Sphaerosporella brunnea]
TTFLFFLFLVAAGWVHMASTPRLTLVTFRACVVMHHMSLGMLNRSKLTFLMDVISQGKVQGTREAGIFHPPTRK